MELSSFQFNETLIKYATNNGDEQTAAIFFKPPCMNNMRFTSKLEQLTIKAMLSSIDAVKGLSEAYKAITNNDSTEKKNAEDTLTMDQVRMMIKTGNVDIMDFVEVFQNFMLSGNCFLDEEGKIKFKQSFLSQIESIEDFTNMMCDYIANFIKPSM